MLTKNQGFNLYLNIANIGDIKPTPSGTFVDKQTGKEIRYQGSISFESENTELIEDDFLGSKEYTTTIFVKVLCESDKDIRPLNEYLRSLKAKGQSFSIPVSLPQKGTDGVYSFRCLYDSKKLIQYIESNQKSPKAQSFVLWLIEG